MIGIQPNTNKMGSTQASAFPVSLLLSLFGVHLNEGLLLSFILCKSF